MLSAAFGRMANPRKRKQNNQVDENDGVFFVVVSNMGFVFCVKSVAAHQTSPAAFVPTPESNGKQCTDNRKGIY